MAPVIHKSGRFMKKTEADRREQASGSCNAHNEKVRLSKEKEPIQIQDAGRRVVDLALLSEQMWCSACNDAISFRFLEKERQRGLASVFHIRCHRCLEIVKIQTSSTVKFADCSGCPLYAVNCKAASGCIDSGIGHDQPNKFLSCVNIPIVHHHTMKRAEARVGQAFETAANASCLDAIVEEKLLTAQSQRSEMDDEMEFDGDDLLSEVGITVEYDFGWDKRVSGFAYNKRNGRGAVVGHKGHKILAWKVASLDCAMCPAGHPPEDHDCRKNHYGTSKSMEPQAAVDLIARNENFKASGVRVDVLVGDEDAATFSHVQQQTEHHVDKWIDTNHVTKKFSNELYNLAKRYPFLNTSVIKYLKRCFCYALSQHKGKEEGLKTALQNIVHHTFGEHDNCGEWCKAKDNEGYIFKHLPLGRRFSSATWRADFQLLIGVYIQKAVQIAPGGSSQNNESFNHVAVTRAPKSRYYGSSPALSYRVAAAVLQKNLGSTHLMDVNKAAGLSPGGITAKYTKMAEEKREKTVAFHATVQFKKPKNSS